MRTAAIVLAAGNSSRLGQPKQFVHFDGRTVLQHAIHAAVEAGCAPILVVTGAAQERVAEALVGLPARVVPNQRWAEGMGSSIAAGVGALVRDFPGCDAVVLMVCDQPLVTGETIAALIDALRAGDKSVAASAYAGTLGVPALFTLRWFAALGALSGNAGAKRIIEANADEVVRCPFPAGDCDIDTPADLERLTVRRRAPPEINCSAQRTFL
jgi:molybdenum cofactor cytidylyltransferase